MKTPTWWFSVAVYNSYGPFYILMYKKTILKRMRTVLFKGYRPCRRPLMRKQSRGMSNAFCLYIFHPHFPKIKCHGVMLIQSFEEMPFVCLWIFDVIFSKFFVLRGSMMLATTVWHVKWKGPDTLLLEPIKKKQKKKLPPAKKLRRVGLITAPCPNSGNVQVASNKENLCAT